MTRLPPWLLPVLGLLSVHCAPLPVPVTKKHDIPLTDPEIDHDKGVDVKTAQALLDRAEAALGEKDMASVTRLCAQAEPFANDALREEIRQMLQRRDQSAAQNLTPEILALARSGECQKAAERVVEIAKEHKGTTVVRFVKDEASKPTLECLLNALSIDVSVARDLAEVTAIKKALNPDDLERWESKLDEATIGSLVQGLGDTIRQRNWPRAVKQLDQMVARKEAGPREVARVMKVVRAGIAEDIAAKADRGIGQLAGAGTLVKEVDLLLAAGRWGEVDPVPEGLSERRMDVAFWSVCASQQCRMVAPAANWAYGLLDVKPVLDLGGKTASRIKHARKVWRIAEGTAWALIADHDPGLLDGILARIPAAHGWVPLAGLSGSDTAERLPPGEAIVGSRVWGRLRDNQKEWELGTVREASGDQLSVERISDGKIVKSRRSEIRFGTLKSGTKVLAMCAHPIHMEAAVINEVIPMSGGDPHVKLTCLDGKGNKTSLDREVLLGSLRAQAASLPPRQ